MNLVVHDYSGHPCQVQLSRWLACRGHTVTHQYCSGYTTGHGALQREPGSPAGYVVEDVGMTAPFARYSPARRIRQELTYGWRAARAIARHRPDVALLSNVPLLALVVLSAGLRTRRIRYVLWQQDIYSAAIRTELRRRLGVPGDLLGALAERLERHVASSSDAVVPISPGFLDKLTCWRLPKSKVHVVPNWGPVDELATSPRENAWAAEHRLTDRSTIVYAGTLGLKHDPSLLADAAHELSGTAEVVVVSEGRGREWLEAARRERGLENLRLFDFQPYTDLPALLGSGDVLLALLEPEASCYSVPSKVLSYLCAGRPIVAVLPETNWAAVVLREAEAGIVVRPGDTEGLLKALRTLLVDPDERVRLGTNGRRYAERTFHSDAVVGQFEKVLAAATLHAATDLPREDELVD